MTLPILCGTDFSPLAQHTARLAYTLARRLTAPFYLLHVADDPEAAEGRLQNAAEALGEGVRAEVLTGNPDEALVDRARALDAGLLMVGSLGRRSLSDWLLGSTAERVVRCSTVPSLVVRDPERIFGWLEGSSPLRVMLAVSRDGSVENALQWLERVSQVGPVETFAVQVSGGSHLNEEWFQAEVDRLHLYTGLPRTACHVEVAQWPVEEHLITLAQRESADLIVMGTHLRTGLERLWRGSVSMAVLRRARLSVACVPQA
jgi:nucleotide-binding universal stress UspA family protein